MPDTHPETVAFSDELMYIVKLLDHATSNRLNVTMVSQALRHKVRTELHRQAGIPTMAQKLRVALDAGCAVQILLWGEWHDQMISPDLLELLYERATTERLPVPGKIAVRISGSTDAQGTIPHYLIAHPPEGEYPEIWMLRMEAPDATLPNPNELRLDSLVPKTIRLSGADAFYASRPLLSIFQRLYDAIDPMLHEAAVIREPLPTGSRRQKANSTVGFSYRLASSANSR